MTPLRPIDEAAFDKASAAAISNALSSLHDHFHDMEWLDSANRYRADASDHVDTLWKSGDGPFKDDELVECIAASSVIHLFEGWTYLSEALRSALRGDVGVVRHLSYYAELRGGLALLSSQGIGVFNSKHMIVNTSGELEKIPVSRGTHEIVWLALEHWGRKEQSGLLIGSNIRGFGNALGDWINAFQGARTNRITGAEWTAQWGFDLKQFAIDRETRNEVSYRANFDFRTKRLSPVEMSSWIDQLWQLSNPLASPFAQLDQYLIRSALKRTFETKFQGDPEESYDARVMAACRSLNITSSYPQNFLCGNVETSDPEVLILASKTSTHQGNAQYMEVLSRSYLLLRLATAGVVSSLKAASLSRDDFSFWWRHIGNETCLWKRDLPPMELEDLWNDIELSLDSIKEWRDEAQPGILCWNSFHQRFGADMAIVTNLEKVALWGLA